MDKQNKNASASLYINRMVAVILDDVGIQPIPTGAENRLTEILQAISDGKATIDMAVDVIRLFPYAKAA